MDYVDNSYVPVSWATLDSETFHDGKAACMPCTINPNPPAPGVGLGSIAAPPPLPGMAPCVACPSNATFPQRLNVRDEGPPCCTTESYSYNKGAWPWQYGGMSLGESEALTPSTTAPQLWQDLYTVKDRRATGFALSPIFNPYVL